MVRSADSSALSSEWASRNMRQSDTKAVLKRAAILLSAHCDTSDQISRAKALLKETGAEDIASTSEASAEQPVATRS